MDEHLAVVVKHETRGKAVAAEPCDADCDV